MKFLNVPSGLISNYHEMKLTDGVHGVILHGVTDEKNTQQEQTELTEMGNNKTSISSVSSCSGSENYNLLPQMFEGLAHRCAGNLDHALQRMVHLQDNKNRA